jgi:chromosome segregation ATPase
MAKTKKLRAKIHNLDSNAALLKKMRRKIFELRTTIIVRNSELDVCREGSRRYLQGIKARQDMLNAANERIQALEAEAEKFAAFRIHHEEGLKAHRISSQQYLAERDRLEKQLAESEQGYAIAANTRTKLAIEYAELKKANKDLVGVATVLASFLAGFVSFTAVLEDFPRVAKDLGVNIPEKEFGKIMVDASAIRTQFDVDVMFGHAVTPSD